MTSSLTRLVEGVRQFRRNVYPQKAETYREAVLKPQQPHTLFITCADSRIDPELITQSGPGEIFVNRNVGNLVPAYGAIGGVSAVIEYAVSALRVSQIVICGHSDCGAMKALLAPQSVASYPAVREWLLHGEAAVSMVRSRRSLPDQNRDELHDLIEENVLLQMLHLSTHPSVAGRLAQGDLAIHGWVYDIGTGDVRMHDPAQRRFISVDELPDPAQS